MANLKKGFVVALAVVTFLCLLQNGRALEQEEKFWAEQYDDWQPSKYTIKTRPTSRVSSQPSPNESINDSSLNLAERNIDPRQRNRNENVGRTFVEGQRSHYDVRGGNFNEERLVNQPVRSPNSNNNNNNNNNRRTRNGFGGFPRRRSEIETSTEFKTNVEYVRRPETTNNVRRFDYKNDQIEGTNGNGDFEVSRTQFSRRSDDIGRSVYPSRRFQVVRKRVPLERRVGGGVNSEPTAQAQLERRMGVGVDDVPTAQAQLERRMGVGVNDVPTAQAQLPVSPDIGNARKNAVVFRGRKHYSPADDNLGKDPTALDRSLQTRFNSKYTTLEVASPPPPDLNEPSQKAFIVLPENQQFRFNEINQQKNGFNQPKTQQNVIPDGRDYQRTRQTLLKQNQQTYRGNNNQYNQYDGRIPQGTKSAENVNRNSNFVFSSFDVGQTTESPKSNVLYQYPENSFLNTLNQQWAPQTNNALTSPRALLQDDLENSKFPQTNVDKPLDSNRPPDVSPNTSQYQGFDPTTSRSTRRNNQAFRSRTPQRRGEYTTTKRYVVENALPDSAIARSQHTNTFEPFVQTNLIAERHSENKTTEFRGQNNYLGRQRRRQSPSRTNPTKSPVFTVLPSSTAEPANNNFNEIPNLPFEPKSRQENPGSRFSYLRQRSRTPQSNLKPAPVYDPRQRYRNANEVEAEKTSQNPVTPTLRSVTRTTVSRTTTTVTEKPTENKVEEEIDDSANYPKEFLEKLKSSKEQQAPKIHATAPGALLYANDRNVDKVPKWPALESPSQQGRFAQSFRRKTSDKNVNSPVSRNKLEPATKKVNFQATQTPISIPSTISTTFSRIPSTASDTSTTTTTTAVTQESRRFVPKNKISLEQRKQRIELLKEKLRKNATASAERHNLRETLVPQANTHHSSREESDHLPFEDHFHVSSSSSQPSTTAVASLSSETDIKNSHLKQDLLILGSEDHTFISYLDGINGTDKFSESFATSTENPTTTTFTPFSEAVTTQQPDFSVLNVTLFPSTRHRFSSRINSTTNLTIPEDVELINITPTVENTASTEPSLEVSLLNLFNSSLNATGTNENTPETLSVTARLDESTTNFPASTSTTPKSPRSVNTTNRTTTKKKPSGRKKSNKKSSSSTGSTGSPRRGASNKSKTIKNKNSASTTTVSPLPQRILDGGNNTIIETTTTNGGVNTSSVDVQPLPLNSVDVESIINETMEVVNSNRVTSPKPGTVPRSELNALTPETFYSANNSTGAKEAVNTRPETTTPMSTPADTNNNLTNNTQEPNTGTNVQCMGESCKNATSKPLHINNVTTKGDSKIQSNAGQLAAAKSPPKIFQKIFIFGIFPNNTIRKRPYLSSGSEGVGSLEITNGKRLSTTTTTTTTPPPDYDVFGIYPNNSIVRRRGWKTFDHERYKSPYVIFGIYPNNTIVKKYPNGTIIEDEFMISDNEIRTMMKEHKKTTTCTCANDRKVKNESEIVSAVETPRRTTTTETSQEGRSEPTTTGMPQGRTEPTTTEISDSSANEIEADEDAENGGQKEDMNATTENGETTKETPTTESAIEKEGRDDDDTDDGNNEINDDNDENVQENGAENEENEENFTERGTTSSPINDQFQNQIDDNETISTTLRPEVDAAEKLEEIEKLDDVSTPQLGIGETTTSVFERDRGEEKELDDANQNAIINLSTTVTYEKELQLKELDDAEQADAAKISGTTTEPSSANEFARSSDSSTMSEFDSATTQKDERLESSSSPEEGRQFEGEITTTESDDKSENILSTEGISRFEVGSTTEVSENLRQTTTLSERSMETSTEFNERLQETTTAFSRGERLEEITIATTTTNDNNRNTEGTTDGGNERYRNLETTTQSPSTIETTTPEFFYYRPTENSPLSLDIQGDLIEKLTPRIDILTKTYVPDTQTLVKGEKTTTEKPKPVQNKLNDQAGLPFLRNNFFRNLISSWFNQPTPKPAPTKPKTTPKPKPIPKGKPAAGTTSVPYKLNQTPSISQSTTAKPLKPDGSFTIDLFGSNKVDSLKGKQSGKVSTTTNRVPTATSFVSIVPSIDLTEKVNLKNGKVIGDLNSKNIDESFRSTTVGHPNGNALFVDGFGNLGPTIGPNLGFTPIPYLSSNSYSYEGITPAPIYNSIGPISSVKPVGPVGSIISVTPVGPVSSLNSISPVGSVSSVKPLGSVSSISSITPVSPVGSVSSIRPVGSVSSEKPVGSVSPISSINPVGSVGSISSVKPGGPIGSIISVTPLGPVDSVSSVKPVGSVGSVKPVSSVGSVGSVKPVGSINSVSSVKPVGSFGPIVSVTPLGPVNSMSSVKSGGPVGSVSTIKPVNSVGSVGSLKPVGSIGSVSSVKPIGSFGSIVSVTPLGPVDSVSSLKPMGSVGPVSSMKPLGSIGSVTPISPVNSISSFKPLGSVGSIISVTPVSPVSSVNSISPVSSIGSVTPISPVNSINSVKPVGPVGSIISVTPVDPIGTVSSMKPMSPVGSISSISPISPISPISSIGHVGSIGQASPTIRPLSDAGIVSVSFEGNVIDHTTPKVLASYQVGPSPVSPYIQRITTRQVSTTESAKTLYPTSPRGNVLIVSNNVNGLDDKKIHQETFYAKESTTKNYQFPDKVNGLREDYFKSTGSPKLEDLWKRTNDSDEPSSLTNVAFRALSTANEIPLLDVMATTTTMTTTTTRPKKTKTATNSSGRIKIKKMKNLSRTSVMAYKNETQMTSTTAPETVFIVTPMSKTEFGDFGAEPYGDPEMKRQKVKFVTLTPGYVVMTDVRNQNENDILTLSSQHVQKVTKAPANIPDNFLSTVYGEIQEKASSPLPEILKNVGNEFEGGNGLSVSLAKRIISLALENAVTTSTTPTAPHSAPSFPSSPDLPSPTPSNQKIPAKHDSIKSANPTKRPKSTSFVTTTEKIHPPVTANPTKGQRVTPRPTTTTTTTTKPIQEETILITPKRQAVQKVEKKTSTFLQSTEEIPVVTFGGEIFKNPTTKKAETTSSPFIELFNKGIPNKPLSSQKVNEDLNALLSGLWQEPTRQPESFTTTTQRIPTSTTVTTTTTTTMTTTTKRTTTKATTTTSTSTKPPNFSNVSSRSKSQQQQQKKIKDEKISLPKKASDALSESDLKLLEGILAQQGIMGGDKELEKIIQNQIRLAEEVRKASRNIKKKKITTTTTTTERTNSGSLGFIFNLFGSNGISNQPAPRGNSKKNTPQTEPDSELNNTPDPFDELNEDTAVADRTARGELVSAAVDVTKAVSKFMGTVLTSAAQSLQTFVRSLRS